MTVRAEKKPAKPHPAVELLRQHAQTTEAYLAKLPSRFGVAAPARLMEAVRYSLLAGGKRLRPALVLETHRAVAESRGGAGGDGRADGRSGQGPGGQGPGGRESALAAAAAMELVHTFSLVHDDLPAMDDDDLRRGVPTNHKVFGEAMAILAGDAMITLAFEVLAAEAHPSAAVALVRELALAAGPQGMIGGQAMDIQGQGRGLNLEELKALHRMKTGALITASCRMGAIAAGAAMRASGPAGPELAAVTSFGQHLGLAFQIVDDILDVTSTPRKLGKATNKDASRGKNTFPTLLGLEESRAEAARQSRLAQEAISPLGRASDGLAELAAFVVQREH
jgi:geranylgeranyl diphosphate synthase type II